MQIKNNYNAHKHTRNYEVNIKPSMTVPDQTMGLKELLDRFARGLPLTGKVKEPQFHGEDMPPDLKKMDLTEIHELQRKVAKDIERMKQELQQQQEQQNAKNQLEMFRKWQEEQIQQTQNNGDNNKGGVLK